MPAASPGYAKSWVVRIPSRICLQFGFEYLAMLTNKLSCCCAAIVRSARVLPMLLLMPQQWDDKLDMEHRQASERAGLKSPVMHKRRQTWRFGLH